MVKKTKTVTSTKFELDELLDTPVQKSALLVPAYSDRGFMSWSDKYPSLDSFKAYVSEVRTGDAYVTAEFSLCDGYHTASVSFDFYSDEDGEEDRVLEQVSDFRNSVDGFVRAVEKAVEARRMARKVSGE